VTWQNIGLIIGLLAITVFILYKTKGRNTTILKVGQTKSIRLGGHRVTIKFCYKNFSEYVFYINVCLKNGKTWKQQIKVNVFKKPSLIFPRRNHGRTWTYEVVGQEVGKNQVRVSLRKRVGSRRY
jgi:uncharacterized membrane protein